MWPQPHFFTTALRRIGGNFLSQAAWWCLVGGVLVGVSLWATRPLASGMWDHVCDLGDALYTAWALDHNYRILTTGTWDEYWRAPMFNPYPYSLALADAHLGTAIWTWPIYWATHNAVFAQNVAILSSFVLTGLACYLLAAHVTARRWLALVLAIAGMVIPFRLAQLVHLQLLMTQWLLFAVWCLLRCAERPHWGYVVGFGASCVMSLTSSLYYGLFQMLLLLPLGLALGLGQGWYRPTKLLRAWVWVGLAVLVVSVPFVMTYRLVYAQEAFDRSLDEIIQGSGQPGDLLNVTPRHWLALLPGLSIGPIELTLFPGVTLTGAVVLSLLAAARDYQWWPAIRSSAQRLWCWGRQRSQLIRGIAVATMVVCVWLAYSPFNVTVNLKHDFMRVPWLAVSGTFVLVLGVSALAMVLPLAVHTGWLQRRGPVFWCWCGLWLSVLLSFGPMIRYNTTELALGPYALLYRFVPGFEGLRVPARLCLLSLPLLVLLAAHVYDRLLTTNTEPRIRRAAALLIVGFLALDLAVDPCPWRRVPLEHELPHVFRWLRDNGGPGGVLVLPTDDLGQYRSPLYLYYGIYHRRPLLNGYPAFMPAECHDAQLRASAFPQPGALELLAARGIRYVVLDLAELIKERQPSGLAALIAECDNSPAVRREPAASNDQFLLYEVLRSSQDGQGSVAHGPKR